MASGPASRTRKPQPPQRPGADWASGYVGTLLAVVPALRGQVAALEREHPRPTEAELVDDRCSLVVGALAGEVRRHEPQVVLVGREQVAGRQVAGLDPLAPRHPRRGDDGLVAGQQHDLVDGDGVLAGHVRDRHGPDPAGVARLACRRSSG